MSEQVIESKKRVRRTPDEIVADYEAKIADVRSRQKRSQIKGSPAVRQLFTAVKAIEKGIAAAVEEQNVTLKTTLNEVREPLAAYLALEGLSLPQQRERRPRKPKTE
jgi:hypothetical protein